MGGGFPPGDFFKKPLDKRHKVCYNLFVNKKHPIQQKEVMRMKKNLETYLHSEIFYTKLGFENETDIDFKRNNLKAGIQRCLGACQFAEFCGMDEQEVGRMYAKAKAELEALV